MILKHWKFAVGLVALSCALGASAQGVLARISGGGKLVIAHREMAVPFSYVDAGKPVGYAIDLCLRIAEVVRKKTGMKDMSVEFMQVTPANRIDVIRKGQADLECGSTTNNAERRQSVAFTIPHFITGARLLVSSASTVDRLEDLEGKKLVSTQGTTPLKAVQQVIRERRMAITVLEAPEHGKAVEMVEKGEADAFVMDDVLLYGLAANRPDPKALKVVGRFVT
ncbi:MAG: amino acid ABC transporter substrate-binding protein, partial [Comamonadaceae bacterium]